MIFVQRVSKQKSFMSHIIATLQMKETLFIIVYFLCVFTMVYITAADIMTCPDQNSMNHSYVFSLLL